MKKLTLIFCLTFLLGTVTMSGSAFAIDGKELYCKCEYEKWCPFGLIFSDKKVHHYIIQGYQTKKHNSATYKLVGSRYIEWRNTSEGMNYSLDRTTLKLDVFGSTCEVFTNGGAIKQIQKVIDQAKTKNKL